MNLLHAPDAAVITAYVVIVEKLDRLRARMTSEPEVVRNPANGMPMPNPVFDQWLKACTKMESLATSSGSTRRPGRVSGRRSRRPVRRRRAAPSGCSETDKRHRRPGNGCQPGYDRDGASDGLVAEARHVGGPHIAELGVVDLPEFAVRARLGNRAAGLESSGCRTRTSHQCRSRGSSRRLIGDRTNSRPAGRCTVSLCARTGRMW